MATPSTDGPETLREERTYAALSENERSRFTQRSPLVQSQNEGMFPLGPRVRWGGIIGGCVVAIGLLMLLTSFGLAVGFSTMGDLWRMNTETATDFTTGVGAWTALSLLISFFVAGLVSTKVTDRPDRGGAVLHGTITWVLLSLFLPWLLSSEMSRGVAGIGVGPGVESTPNALTTAPDPLTMAELSGILGLDDPDQVSTQLADPRVPLLLAATTGISVTEAQTAVDDLRARIAPLQEDPAAVNGEVSSFLARIVERAQGAPQIPTHFKGDAEVGSWMIFGVMALTLLVSIMGAFTGIPDRRRILLARK